MCGRYVVATEELFLKGFPNFRASKITPRYNIAPTQLVPVLRDIDAGIEMLKWGLIPRWAKDSSIAHNIINARSETIAEKPAFKDAFKNRRCIILSTGFYEWKREGTKKTPYYIFAKDREYFSFAGLWENWKSPEGEIVETCTIVTTAANEFIRPLHNRMPAIIRTEDFQKWLNKDAESETLKKLLQPFPNHNLEMYRVSTFVNNPKNESEECIKIAG
jgi:putative SOS response-associated peptidase YedK